MENVEWELRSSLITNPDGSLVFKMENFRVPKGWSQVAVDILAQKYFRRAGIPAASLKVAEPHVPTWLQRSIPDGAEISKLPDHQGFKSESDAHQVFNRLAGCWTYWGWKNGFFSSEKDARIFYNEMYVRPPNHY